MTTLEQAARQALEALETISVDVKTTSNAYEAQRQAIAALSQALENHKSAYQRDVAKLYAKYDALYKEQPKQEPVAWHYQSRLGNDYLTDVKAEPSPDWHETPLYTAPPKREWIGLTDEEIAQGNTESWVTIRAWQSAVWWADERLKEKNT